MQGQVMTCEKGAEAVKELEIVMATVLRTVGLMLTSVLVTYLSKSLWQKLKGLLEEVTWA